LRAGARGKWVGAVLWSGALAGAVWGQDQDAPVTAVEHARQRARPRYEFLRFDDDFSYLDGPEGSYQEDCFDPIKNIRLGDDLTLSLGGEIRFRLDSKRNEFLRPGPTSHDTFLLDRYALHLDARYRMLARVFVEGIHANVYDRDEFLFFIHRNEFDLHQLFADVRVLGEEVPLTLRIGRQEHAYGRQRVISPWGWGVFASVSTPSRRSGDRTNGISISGTASLSRSS
jgi:hypothetical protein